MADHSEHPPIVGREREQQQLREVLDRTLDGYGSLVLVGGEAGIGKTTLVSWLVDQAGELGMLVLSGGCYDLSTTPPYGPWVEITRAYGDDDDLPPLPQPLADEEGLGAIPTQGALFRLVATFFADVAARRPLLLVLEDLHWSDLESPLLLRNLARELARAPVLIVATYRDDELTRRHPLFQLLPVLARESDALRLNLRRWGADVITELIETRYQLDARDRERLVTHLEERTEGNPFFIEEVLHAFEAEEILQASAETWQLLDVDHIAIPIFVVQFIEGRLSRLAASTRQLLEIAAVIGQEVSLDLIMEMSETDEAELASAVAQALEAYLFEESADRSTIRFRHALVREALYAEIAPLQRRVWHRVVADALISQHRPDPDEVVTHLEQAHDPRALEWLVRAGDRAMRRFAWEVAIQRYERAMELSERQDEPDLLRQCEILLALGDAQNRVAAGRLATATRPTLGGGGSYTGRDTFWRAAEIARVGGTCEQLAQAALGVVGFNPYPQQGGVEGVYLLEEALERLPADDSPLRVQLLARLGVDPYFQAVGWGTLPFTSELQDQVRARSDAAVAMARRLGDPASLAYALVMRGLQEELRPDEEWLAVADEAVQAATAAGDRPLLARALGQKHAVLERWGDVASRRVVMNQLAGVAEELRLPLFLWAVACGEASVALSEGRLAEAEQYIDEADRIQPQSGFGTALRIAVRLEQGRGEELSADLFSEYISFFYLLWLLVQLETGRYDQAQEGFSEIVNEAIASGDIGRPQMFRLRWLTWLAEVCAGLDSVEHAGDVYDALLPHAYQNVPESSSYRGGCVSYYLGLLATTMARWEEAEPHFAEALELNKRWGYRLHVTKTQYAWADMLIRRGRPADRPRAKQLLDQAQATSTELGLVRLERMVSELAGTLGKTVTEYPAGLTPREVEVLRLAAEDLTDNQIGEQLYISPRTVSQHLRNAYNKIGVNSRVAAVRWAVENGLV